MVTDMDLEIVFVSFCIFLLTLYLFQSISEIPLDELIVDKGAPIRAQVAWST